MILNLSILYCFFNIGGGEVKDRPRLIEHNFPCFQSFKVTDNKQIVHKDYYNPMIINSAQ